MEVDIKVSGRQAKVLSFDQYMDNWRDKNALPMRGLDKVQRRMLHYSRYNYERQLGVEASYEMSAAFQTAVMALKSPQTWFFITDDWCIDSAYSLPLLLRAAELRANIELHILMRDDNLEIMDDYLSDGRRSIPILAGFDAADKQLFRWGPHPDILHQLRTSLQEAGEPGRVVSASTIDWYADNGQLEVEREFTVLFNSISESVNENL